MKIQEITTKDILSKTNLPIGDYAVNPYVEAIIERAKDRCNLVWQYYIIISISGH